MTQSELSQITDVFTRMFVDTHTKVFGLFLDVVGELINTHADHLHDWLYLLITRYYYYRFLILFQVSYNGFSWS